MRLESDASSRWYVVLVFAVVLGLVTAWLLTADRAGAEPASGVTVAHPANMLDAALSLHPTDDTQIFAKYDGIEGESTDAIHDKWIDVLSVEWGAQLPEADSPSSQRRGAPTVDGLVLSFHFEKANPPLEEKLLNGQIIPKLEIEFVSSFGGARATYLKYELKNVRLTDFVVKGEEFGGSSHTSFVNQFEEIKVTYTEYDDTGGSQGDTTYTYNVLTNS